MSLQQLTRDFDAEREAFVWAFIGDNRTGKSVTALEYAKAWKRARPNGTIIAHDPQRRFNGVKDLNIPDGGRKGWAEWVARQKDVLLVLDELRLIHGNDKAEQGLKELMANRGENNIDIIYIVHNPKLIINFLTYYTHMYFIFRTNSKRGQFSDKIPSYELAHGASILVNKYTKAFGKGAYPFFPYVVADTKNEELIAVNMSEHRDFLT